MITDLVESDSPASRAGRLKKKQEMTGTRRSDRWQFIGVLGVSSDG
jgi:hypothetical protein